MKQENQIVLETPRLSLRPMTDAEAQALRARTGDPELRDAYAEMLEGCQRDPAHRIWYAPWQMTARAGGAFLGDLCFKGPAAAGAVEIGYGILQAFKGHGYTTEAVRALTRWALSQPGVTAVEAETDPENRASQRILEKCGFTPTGTQGKEGPRFRCIAAPKTAE